MKAGDKVVCVDAEFFAPDVEAFRNVPKEGMVYVIREVVLGRITYENGLMVRKDAEAVLLVGVNNPPFPTTLEPAFHAARFRLLEDVRRENGIENIQHEDH